MLRIQQFRYSVDNFAYVIYGNQSAGVIDGGADEKILAFTADRDINLTFAANTHTHQDHTVGTRQLIDATGAHYLDNKTLLRQPSIPLEGEIIAVHHTPGHTTDSLCFHFGNVLVTGDTLFNGTIGNCFSGDLKRFLQSLKMLMAFPAKTVIYAGHDYVKDSIAFARTLEPGNTDIDIFMKSYNPEHICSTLQEELKINPYLKFNDRKITTILQQKGLPVDTEYKRWESLMSLE